MSEFKEYEEWEASLDQKYLKQLSPDAFELSPAAFYAGQQSQQAKIDLLEVQLKGAEERAKLTLDHKDRIADELQKKYNAMYNAFTVADDCRKELHESYISARKDRDELQARVDKALERMDAESSNSWGLWKEKADMYEQGASDAYEKSYWILKGNKDEI